MPFWFEFQRDNCPSGWVNALMICNCELQPKETENLKLEILPLCPHFSQQLGQRENDLSRSERKGAKTSIDGSEGGV